MYYVSPVFFCSKSSLHTNFFSAGDIYVTHLVTC